MHYPQHNEAKDENAEEVFRQDQDPFSLEIKEQSLIGTSSQIFGIGIGEDQPHQPYLGHVHPLYQWLSVPNAQQHQLPKKLQQLQPFPIFYMQLMRLDPMTIN